MLLIIMMSSSLERRHFAEIVYFSENYSVLIYYLK